jgi:hypothetical protein
VSSVPSGKRDLFGLLRRAMPIRGAEPFELGDEAFGEAFGVGATGEVVAAEAFICDVVVALVIELPPTGNRRAACPASRAAAAGP